MLIETMMICALITTSPFYDCDQKKWEINIYDDIDMAGIGTCKESQYKYGIVHGCATFSDFNTMGNYLMPPVIHIGSSKNIDEWGMTTLEHELEHVKCRCQWEGHD